VGWEGDAGSWVETLAGKASCWVLREQPWVVVLVPGITWPAYRGLVMAVVVVGIRLVGVLVGGGLVVG
jgi:hypothetical protein